MISRLKIGARGSPLSLAQTELVAQDLRLRNPGLEVEVIPIKTSGDRLQTAPLALFGGKGLFVKEIEEALLAGTIDLAVHSAKDLPAVLPDALIIGATPGRADFRDALISRKPGGLEALRPGESVGTSGLRRQAQLLARRPDLLIKPVRGNVGTRLKKLETEFSATLLAAAGLNRLGLEPKNLTILPPAVMLPAAGQGILALEIRREDRERLADLLSPIHDQGTFLALSAERGFLRALGGDCSLPVAALARFRPETILLEGLLSSPDGRRQVRKEREFPIPAEPSRAADLGAGLAETLLSLGGKEIMRDLCRSAEAAI